MRRDERSRRFFVYESLVIVSDKLLSVKSVVPLFLKSIVVVPLAETTVEPPQLTNTNNTEIDDCGSFITVEENRTLYQCSPS